MIPTWVPSTTSTYLSFLRLLEIYLIMLSGNPRILFCVLQPLDDPLVSQLPNLFKPWHVIADILMNGRVYGVQTHGRDLIGIGPPPGPVPSRPVGSCPTNGRHTASPSQLSPLLMSTVSLPLISKYFSIEWCHTYNVTDRHRLLLLACPLRTRRSNGSIGPPAGVDARYMPITFLFLHTLS